MSGNIWDQVLARIETKVNRHSFYTWFKPTSCVSDEGAVVRVRVPNALFREAAAVAEGVRSNGWAVAGPGRPDSVVIDRLGVFSKFGAEGVQVMAAPDGTTVALKMLDGSSRASAIVAARLLASAGALETSAVDAVEPDLGLDVLGGGAVVGRIRATV